MSRDGRGASSRRITLVADELLGYARNGLGTTTSFLALAFARLGHQVEVLFLGPPPAAPIDREWAELYDRFGVTVTPARRGSERVEPSAFARMRDVDRALRERSADVVVTQDLGAPAYAAMRLRKLGLAFESTSFVVVCHGTRQWIADSNRKVRVLPGALAISVLERACVELADVAVSPSAYMADWMRDQSWELPERTLIVPHPTRFAATGELPQPAPAANGRSVERLAFFGRLEERKGLESFLKAVNALDPGLLASVELDFVGRPTPAWPPARVESLLSEDVRRGVRGLSFETELDQHEALARLSRPGTLAVMPSFAEAFGNTIRECLDLGIPFLASNAPAICELVAPEDRARVLCEPTPEGIAEALRRALRDGSSALRPARPAFDPEESLRRWQEVLALAPRPLPAPGKPPQVEVVVLHRGSRAALARCLAALAAQEEARPEVLVVLCGPDLAEPELPAGVRMLRSLRSSPEQARAAALPALRAEWVLFLDEEDVPEPHFLARLCRAQEASGADVVSCGLFLAREEGTSVRLFFGEPRALGLVENGYGTVSLLRRSLLSDLAGPWPAEADPDWPLLAGLSAQGAKIVSVPEPLLSRQAQPGAIERSPADALLVVEALERILPSQLAACARLAAGLAADARRPPSTADGLARRAVGVVRREGILAFGRRAARRLTGGTS
jgi:glycosyltransferase involved in cell wall biosynthesis